MILTAKPTIVRVFIRVMFILITIIFVKGLLFMEDTALLGTLFLHELVVYSALFPRNLLLLAIEWEEEDFWLLLFLLGWRGWWLRVQNCYGGGGGGSDRRGRQCHWPGGVRASVHGCSLTVQRDWRHKYIKFMTPRLSNSAGCSVPVLLPFNLLSTKKYEIMLISITNIWVDKLIWSQVCCVLYCFKS